MATIELTQELIDALTYEVEFGQHKGKSVEWLLEHQPGYCDWILKQPPSNNKVFSKAKIMIMVGLGMDKSKVQEALGAELNYKIKKQQEDKKEDNDIIPTILFSTVGRILKDKTAFDFVKPEDAKMFNAFRTLYQKSGRDTLLMIKRSNFVDSIVGYLAKDSVDKNNGKISKMAHGEIVHA